MQIETLLLGRGHIYQLKDIAFTMQVQQLVFPRMLSLMTSMHVFSLVGGQLQLLAMPFNAT